MAHTLQTPYTESSLCGKVGADTSFDDLLCLESEDEFWDNLPGEDSLFDNFCPEPSEPNEAKPVSVTEERWKSMRIPADNRSIALDALPEWYRSRRERLIESMEALGRKLDLAPCTVAHCAAILDTFIAKNRRQDNLAEEVFCVATLWIAAKFNESATNAPSADQMLEGLTLKKDLLLKAELYILQGVEWRIQIITVHEALAFLNSIEVSPASESLSALKQVKGKHGGADQVGGYSEFLADMVMLDSKFVAFSATLTAASCFAVARHGYDVAPTWPPELEKLTGYSMESIKHCVALVSSTFQSKFASALQEDKKALALKVYRKRKRSEESQSYLCRERR